MKGRIITYSLEIIGLALIWYHTTWHVALGIVMVTAAAMVQIADFVYYYMDHQEDDDQ